MRKIQNVCWFSVLVFGLVLAACFDYVEPGDLTDAEVPVIDTQPAPTTIHKLGDSTDDLLSVTASSSDGGTLSYQWYTYDQTSEYQNGTGTPVTNGKNAAFSPVFDTDGTFRYYVVVTNTKASNNKKASKKSEPAIVTVTDPNNAQYPAISTQPQSTTAYLDPSVTVTLSVAASVIDGGDLTYQWYSNTSPTTSNGTKIDGADDTSYTFSISAAGTYYYYAIVTNTLVGAQQREKSDTPSELATIRVNAFNATFTVNTATKYQYVRGFGAMSTGGFRAGNGDTSPDVTVQDIETAFDPVNGLGLNFLRIMLYDDLEGVMNGTCSPALNRANVDISDYFDIVKKVNEYGGYVLASPWTPPAGWKTSNSLIGSGNSNLKVSNYVDYANHLRDFCQRMYDEGAPIYAVSIQNEPNANVGYEGCKWTSDEMRNFFLTTGVGAFTRKNSAGQDAYIPGYGGGEEIPYVLIMNGETMSDMSVNNGVMNNTTTRNCIDLIGRHMYGGRSSYWSSRQGKEVWMTEYTDTENMSSYYPVMNQWRFIWRFLNVLDWSIRQNNENAFIWWYMKRFYCIIGDGDQSAIEHQILPRGWAMSHYAKFGKDTNRVEVTASGTLANGTTNISASNVNNTTYDLEGTAARVTAFESMDGNSVSLVMFTPTPYDDTTNANGINMGNIKIKLPAGFVIGRAEAIRSTVSGGGQHVPEAVVISADKNSAFVTLPVSNILSVRFTRE